MYSFHISFTFLSYLIHIFYNISFTFPIISHSHFLLYPIHIFYHISFTFPIISHSHFLSYLIHNFISLKKTFIEHTPYSVTIDDWRIQKFVWGEAMNATQSKIEDETCWIKWAKRPRIESEAWTDRDRSPINTGKEIGEGAQWTHPQNIFKKIKTWEH